MNATQRRICFSIVVLAQSGCATQAPRPPDIQPGELASIGVANVQYLPKLNLEEAKGIETSMALRQCSGIGVPAIVTLACMPFAAQAAADALRAGTSTLTPAQAEAHFRERLSTLRPQSALREHLARYATEQRMVGVRAIDEGPATLETQHKYRAASGAPSMVAEVAIVQVAAKTTGVGNVPYFFTVTANGRLVRTSDNAVLDSFANTQATRVLPADAWVADDGKALAHELDRAYRRLAEAFVDEWFLIYRAPAEEATSGAAAASSAVPSGYSGGMQSGTVSGVPQDTGIVPLYVLQPISPAVSRGVRGPGSVGIWGNLVAARVENLQPTLKWEALPRPALAAPDAGAAKPVYEVRIFRAFEARFAGIRLWQPLSEPEIAVGELTAAEFRPAEPLYPCETYFWTVRARFESAGYPKVTEWSGAYHATTPSFEPWTERRSAIPLGSRTPAVLYFPFETPTRSGQRC